MIFGNNILKKLIFVFVLFFFTSVYSQNSIELVESIPIETTLDNPDIKNTQEVWLEMINSAQKTLDIEQFYISNEKGEPLDTILNAIVAAAKRGVTVRIIIDAGMYKTYPESADEFDKFDNIEVREIDVKSLAGGIQHAKYFIVDSKEVFLGSQNFDWRALNHIHELGVRIKSDIYIPFQNIFELDWRYAGSKDNVKWISDTTSILAVNKKRSQIFSDLFGTIYPKAVFSPHGFIIQNIYSNWDLNSILKMIYDAKSEINLQFLSYNPVTKDGYWEEIDTALINASKRGVKVKLIVSDWNLGKTAVEHFKELIHFPNFEIKYTSIPDYSGGYIPFARVEHCKFISADSVCWIGTSNMSYDYFYESRNAGVVIENGKFTQRVRDIFYKSWRSEYAHRIEPNGEYIPRKRN